MPAVPGADWRWALPGARWPVSSGTSGRCPPVLPGGGTRGHQHQVLPSAAGRQVLARWQPVQRQVPDVHRGAAPRCGSTQQDAAFPGGCRGSPPPSCHGPCMLQPGLHCGVNSISRWLAYPGPQLLPATCIQGPPRHMRAVPHCVCILLPLLLPPHTSARCL